MHALAQWWPTNIDTNLIFEYTKYDKYFTNNILDTNYFLNSTENI